MTADDTLNALADHARALTEHERRAWMIVVVDTDTVGGFAPVHVAGTIKRDQLPRILQSVVRAATGQERPS